MSVAAEQRMVSGAGARQPRRALTSPRSAGRLPSLDGIRAISIVMVILAHFYIPVHSWVIGTLGSLGVRIFFVLSGFLITTLLLEEYGKTGKVSLPRFYFRRTLRIFPAAYTFIAVLFLLHDFGVVPLARYDMLHALTYTMNYYPGRSWHIGHLWSLGVEEQFYLLWPAGIALLGPARGRWLAVGGILGAPLFRMATRVLFPDWGAYVPQGETFPEICDTLATGCLLALMRSSLERHPGYVRWLSARALLWLPLLIPAFNIVKTGTLLNLLIALWIHRSVYIHTDEMGRFLNWRPCQYVGQLSYSLYIWQQLFLNNGALLTPFPINLLCVAGAGMASYYLVESPFLKWRSHLEKAWRKKVTTRAERERDRQVSQIMALIVDSLQERKPKPGPQQRRGSAPVHATANRARGAIVERIVHLSGTILAHSWSARPTRKSGLDSYAVRARTDPGVG